ncbi:MAG TPA: hypothetical protein VFI65_27775 [Streptosporangiaceae bacterium]|nr:hypothetical protein [Streptosporangiaceae bacterium]
MTLDNDNQAPAEPPAQDVSLSLLTIANPAFRFSFLSAGFHRAKWPGIRRKPAGSDERNVVSPDADDDQDAEAED